LWFLSSSISRSYYQVIFDRTIMLSFVNRWPFYPKTSLEKLPRTAPPLTEIPPSKTAPPLPETTAHALTSLPSPSVKATPHPESGLRRLPPPAWQFGPAIKLCSMDMRLFFSWAFFVSSVFPNNFQFVHSFFQIHLRVN
jgi:hypothetical protein